MTWAITDNSDMYWDGTYGLNTYLSGHGKKKVLLTKRPSERILAQDHIEHFLDNNGGHASYPRR